MTFNNPYTTLYREQQQTTLNDGYSSTRGGTRATRSSRHGDRRGKDEAGYLIAEAAGT